MLSITRSPGLSFKRAGVRILIGAVVLLVLVNALYLLVFAPSGEALQTGSPLEGGRPIKAAGLPEQTMVAVTSDSRIIQYRDQAVVREEQVEGSVTDIGLSAEGQRLYVGTTDREVKIFDTELKQVSGFKVNGRVAAIDAATPGELAVAYGIGQYTDRFWVGLFDEAGEARYKTQIYFDVTAVAAGTEGVYFGTADSKVGYLSPDGEELWRTNVKQPITRLDLNREQQVVVGDERGNVALLSREGKVLWINHLSAYPITMVNASDEEGHLIAGDRDGKVFVLDGRGYGLYAANTEAGSVNSLVAAADGSFRLLTDQGRIVTLSMQDALGARQQDAVRIGLTAINALLALIAAGSLVRSVPAWHARAVRFGRLLKRSRSAYLLLLPSIVLILVFNIAPTVMAVFYSFTNFSLKEPLKWIGLDNFIAMWSDQFFWVGLWNMIIILVTSIIKEITMPLLVAELIFWLRSDRMKYWFRTAYVVPSIVPGVVGILLWKMMYEPETGLINQFLQLIGLESWQRAWLGDESIALWSIIMAGFPFVGIFAFLVFFGGLIGISREIYDSASIDGITPWGRFWRIDLPMIRPQIRLILFFTFIGSIQGFANIYLFTRGGPGTSTYVPGLQMYNQISGANFGYASAIGFVLAIFVLVGSMANLRLSKQEGA